MTWANMKTVRKGDIGEKIVRRILERKGLIVYSCDQDKPHVVDFYCQYPGKALFAVEVKTYPRRYAYNQTGIDAKDYRTYLELWRAGVEVVILFVDEFEQCIYQQRISTLQNFKQPDGSKVYFPLGCMKFERWLTADELEQIKQYGQFDELLYGGTTRHWTRRGPQSPKKEQ